MEQCKIDAVEKVLIDAGVSAKDAEKYSPRLCEVLSEYYQNTGKSSYLKDAIKRRIKKLDYSG